MYVSLRHPPLLVLAVLAPLAAFPLACTDLSVDPAEADGASAVAMAEAVEQASEEPSVLPFNTGLDERQQRLLFGVLAGVTTPDELDPAQREALVRALTEARARAVAVQARQAARQSGLPSQEQTDRAEHDAAFHDFALSFLDKALAALN